MTTEHDDLGTSRRLTRADYARAEQYLPWNVSHLLLNVEVKPHWIEGSDRFWYRRASREGTEFILVDPANGTLGPAFDHARLAAGLSEATGIPHVHNQLPIDDLSFPDGNVLEFTLGGHRWTCDLTTYRCTRGEPATAAPKDEVRSPDGAWAAFLRDGDLYVRRTDDGTEIRLTDDAEPDYDYATLPGSSLSAVTDKLVGRPIPPAVAWSPDSKRLLTYRLDQRQVRTLHLLQSVPPPGSSRPVAHEYRYPLPGDEHVPVGELIIFDLEEKKRTPLAVEPINVGPRTSLFEQRVAWWSESGTHVYVVHASRDQREVSLYVVDPNSGEARVLVQERGSTTVWPGHPGPTLTTVRDVGDDERVIWFSFRSGWGHLYLYDLASGEERCQITSGPWTVRDIVRIDAENGWIYFMGSGREPGRDPYYRHLYRCRLDGRDLTLLTPEDAEHDVCFSPSGAYFVDTYSRIDQPPITVLRTCDGELVHTLAEADITGLLERGWRLPERFCVKARDGITDIYGSIIRPSHFDPNQRYPVLDAIYPGPQIIRTPKAFPTAANGFWQDQALAELGFIVVTIDGMGTPYRSKKFLDVASGANFGEAGGLTDHVVALKQLAARDPSLDLERVGIYGHSGGGYASTRAMLLFPDFYKVAVASAGNHDQLGYNASWGERWIGLVEGDRYATQDNIKLAHRLQGKLLLIHGEMDDNVHPSLTLRLVDALIAAEKDFDLLIIPFTNHSYFDARQGLAALETHISQSHPYFIRKRWDYFVRHLLGMEPPTYAIRPPAPPA